MSGLTDSGNFNQYAAPIVTTWTPATSTTTNVTLNTAGLDTVAITINSSAGITGGQVQFNVWDGAAFIPVKCARLSSYNTDSTYTIPSGGAINGWTVPCAGYPQFQFVLNSAITGSGTVLITTIASSAPDVSIVTAGIDPNSNLPPFAANSAAPTASNGLSSVRSAGISTTAAQPVKASGGKIHRIIVASSATGNNYLKLYNVASGSVVVGTTTPLYTITVPPAGLDWLDTFGLAFSTAISFNVTGAYADSDTTAPTGYTAQVDYV